MGIIIKKPVILKAATHPIFIEDSDNMTSKLFWSFCNVPKQKNE